MDSPQTPVEFSPEWFDASSAAWLANKVKRGSGSYVYRCGHQISETRTCGRAIMNWRHQYCSPHQLIHDKQKEKEKIS